MKTEKKIILSLQRKAGFIGPDFVEIDWCFYSKSNAEYMLKKRDRWRAMQPKDEFELFGVVARTIKYTKL